MKRFTEDNLKEIIDKQMEINGYKERYDDLKEIESWYTKFTTTKEKENEFREYLKTYIKPFTTKSRIDNEIGHFILNYGLKVDYEM